MRFLCYIIVILFPCVGFAQTDSVAHLFAIGGIGIDKGEDIEATADGGYIVVGSNSTTTSGNTDVYLLKVDNSINVEWSFSLGGANNDWGYAVKQTYDKGYIIAVSSNSFGNGGYDAVLMKRDSLGNYEWTKTYGGNDWDFVYDLAITYDSGYVFCGETFNNTSGQSDVFIVRTTKNGDTLWTKTIGGSLTDKGNSIIETSDSSIVVAGMTTTTTDSVQVNLIKLSKTGSVDWNIAFGAAKYEEANAVIETANGDYVIAGYTTSFTPNNDKDFYLARIDTSSNIIWSNFFGNPGEEESFDLHENNQSNIVVTGFTKSAGAGEKDAVIFVVSSSALWLNLGVTFGGFKSDQIKAMTHANNSILLVGNTNSFGVGLDDVLIIKLDTIIPGMDTTLSAFTDNIVLSLPSNQEQKTWSISPNPASTHINLTSTNIKSNTQSILSIVDINGRLLQTKTLKPFENQIDISKIPPGVYSISIHSINDINFYQGNLVIIR